MKATSDENQNSIISIQYCTGYVDKQNQWRPGFNCSGQATDRQAAKNSATTTPLFCCGTSTHKYCCSTKHYMQLGYSGSHNSDVTYGTLLTVVLSTFIFSVMLTIIAFVCCKKFWKSRENLNLEIVDDQLYNRNTNFLTLNAAQLINAYNANGIPIQSDAIRSSTPTSSTNALPQTILSPSITGAHNNSNSNINNSLPAIVSSSMNSYSPSMASNLYTSTNSTQPYTTINQQPLNAQAMTSSINTTFSGQSIAMTGYSVHHQNVHPQALQQALIFYEPPPPYNSNMEINRTYANESTTTASANNSLPPPPSTTATVANTNNPNNSSTSNIDLNTINLLPNSTTQASASAYQPANTNLNLNNDRQTNTQNDLSTTNIFSQRLLLALGPLGNYRRQDAVYPVLDQPRKKLCRTLSQ